MSQETPDCIEVACLDVDLNVEHMTTTLQSMRDAGSRYRNLEKALGQGVVFMLGKELPET